MKPKRRRHRDSHIRLAYLVWPPALLIGLAAVVVILLWRGSAPVVISPLTLLVLVVARFCLLGFHSAVLAKDR